MQALVFKQGGGVGEKVTGAPTDFGKITGEIGRYWRK
jgi:hypothetical protein